MAWPTSKEYATLATFKKIPENNLKVLKFSPNFKLAMAAILVM